MRAIILAGGRGTRLRPLTDKIPKPLIPLNGMPMIERVVRSCEQAGASEIFIVISYKASMIKNYFAGKNFKTKIKFINKNIKNKLELFSLLKNIFHDEKFLLFSTDQIFEPNALVDFINKTKKTNAHMVISTCKHGMSGENKIISDKKNDVMSITRWRKQHYETGFILYSTQIFEISDQLDSKIKNTTELIKLLLSKGYRIKTLKTPDVYDVDNLYSLEKIDAILKKRELQWSFWVVPPSDIRGELSKIVSHINKKYKVLIPSTPHVTVKSGIVLNKKNKRIVENILKEVCNNVKEFEIELDGIQDSPESHKPVFVDVKKTQGLLEFHNTLAKKLESFSIKPERDLRNFEPHLSLAYRNLNKKLRLRIIKDVEKKIDSCKFFVDEAHIVTSSSNPKDWKILKSFKLGV